jgi:hypothetical protein
MRMSIIIYIHRRHKEEKYWVVLPLCQVCLRDKQPISYLNEILSKTDKTWTWCCIIVSSHICWINFEPDKVSFLENNNKCFTNFIQKKKGKKRRIYLPTYSTERDIPWSITVLVMGIKILNSGRWSGGNKTPGVNLVIKCVVLQVN